MSNTVSRIDALALVGPTASGKTAAALAIAARWPVEIISMDSALVYRGMDIGTAKPHASELAQVPHHLIDIRDPTQAYSAADFARDARTLIRDIRARQRLPLVVGGTLLYLKALREGLDDLPPAHAPTRADIEAEAAREGWPAMHAALARVDAVTAQRLPPHDAQRISRALEVWRVSGKALSVWFQEAESQRCAPSALQMPVLSLEPKDRAWLHARIGERFDAMLSAGLVDEVRSLRLRPDLHADLPSMRCVGYRQVWEMLDRADRRGIAADAAVPELRELGCAATRQLAKRQLTWLRGMTDRVVVACDAPDALQRTVEAAEGFIAPGL